MILLAVLMAGVFGPGISEEFEPVIGGEPYGEDIPVLGAMILLVLLVIQFVLLIPRLKVTDALAVIPGKIVFAWLCGAVWLHRNIVQIFGGLGFYFYERNVHGWTTLAAAAVSLGLNVLLILRHYLCPIKEDT